MVDDPVVVLGCTDLDDHYILAWEIGMGSKSGYDNTMRMALAYHSTQHDNGERDANCPWCQVIRMRKTIQDCLDGPHSSHTEIVIRKAGNAGN